MSPSASLLSLPPAVFIEEECERNETRDSHITLLLSQCIQTARLIMQKVAMHAHTTLPHEYTRLNVELASLSEYCDSLLKVYHAKKTCMIVLNYRYILNKLNKLEQGIQNTPLAYEDLSHTLTTCYLILDAIVTHDMVFIFPEEVYTQRASVNVLMT